MIEDDEDRILMSDSLKGQIPDLEEAPADDSFIVFALVAQNSAERAVIAGSLVGIVVDGKDVKVDVKTETAQAFDFITKHQADPWKCLEYHLQFGDSDSVREELFLINSPRMVDIDRSTKTCTLGFDLVLQGNI